MRKVWGLTRVLLQGGLQGGQDLADQRLEPLPQRVRHLLRPAILAGPLAQVGSQGL